MPPASTCHLGLADVIEERGLAVVNVAHDRHDRRARRFVAFDVGNGLKVFLLDRVRRNDLRLVAQFFDEENRSVLVKHLIDRGHDAHGHELLDRIASLERHTLRDLADRDDLGNLDFPRNELRRALEALRPHVGAPAG